MLTHSINADDALTEMVNESKYVTNILKVAQISENAIIHEVIEALKDREAFTDTDTDLNEKVYNGDVFSAILEDNEAGTQPLSKKAITHCEELAAELEYFEYVMITKV
jgi:hypothetical protein